MIAAVAPLGKAALKEPGEQVQVDLAVADPAVVAVADPPGVAVAADSAGFAVADLVGAVGLAPVWWVAFSFCPS